MAAAALRLNLPPPPSSASSSRSGADEAESSHLQVGSLAYVAAVPCRLSQLPTRSSLVLQHANTRL